MLRNVGTINPKDSSLIPAKKSSLTEFPFPNSTSVELPTLSHEGLVFALEGLLKEFQTRANLPCNKHSYDLQLALDAFHKAYTLISNHAGSAVDILRVLKSKVNHNATSIQISLLILALKGKIPPDSGWAVNEDGFLALAK